MLGMIVQEFIREKVLASLTLPAMPAAPSNQERPHRDEPKRYNSPTSTLNAAKVRTKAAQKLARSLSSKKAGSRRKKNMKAVSRLKVRLESNTEQEIAGSDLGDEREVEDQVGSASRISANVNMNPGNNDDEKTHAAAVGPDERLDVMDADTDGRERAHQPMPRFSERLTASFHPFPHQIHGRKSITLMSPLNLCPLINY